MAKAGKYSSDRTLGSHDKNMTTTALGIHID
jgi:hypothetical protein